ncbi:hypothetical protein [Baekduia sp. Peel2402]|uniref:hypothetical protein n=1 Tax=Baekduia sp. Peel2402 TaxID=3458296 RepID=UPI00403EAEF9
MRTLSTRSVLVAALLVSGVLIFADVGTLAVGGFAVTVGLLLAIGFHERRLTAALWAFVLVGSAVVADALWQANWEPFNRSDDYEAIPQTPFVLIGVPIPMVVILLGVAVARIANRPADDDRAS